MANVNLKDITKIYPGNYKAVDRINLEIRDREFMVLVGPSGCGKTTTLRMIAGLESITDGQLLIDGESVNDVASKDRNVAMVFQNYALFPHMTIYENIAFGLKRHKMPDTMIKQAIKRAAEVLNIEELMDRKPDQLSGGQKQRVALGRAMVMKPSVFLMDEPLSNLDAKLRVQMRTELIKLHQELNATFIYVTHDQTEAMTMGTRICVIRNGVIQQVDHPKAIYDHPANAFVASFIGTPQINLLSAILKRDERSDFLVMDGLRLQLPKRLRDSDTFIGKAVTVGIRPEAIALSSNGRHSDFKIQVIEMLGSDMNVHLVHEQMTVVAKLPANGHYEKGMMFCLEIDPACIHLFDPVTGIAIK
ncbi:sn-glycerol-3-phosphate ABC transporter ATP-binding protein UgpC [Fusibacter paucivorans]|uniref:Sn-glycerol-3-phosphate ABC transporter ATP-binding protein UgpC n=1 Tax=Fusibacter paucivorans TaxID=76009 RepID=A0ABS5PNW5_9FIRM|nr:sn-glycerol-3-phosphate ABC transporter ATP-binding protein UgpC [Fusibacter paucivorans]MBS7526069.1 sn-glycerol-3-phosphate ABC transporter ATP-binding protein UgpC [Fusibacter paucivorans]